MGNKRKVFLYELNGTIKCEFDSQCSCGEYLGVSEATVRYHCDKLKVIKGYYIFSSPSIAFAGSSLLKEIDDSNISTSTNCLSERLSEIGQTMEQVKSVKIWQTSSGETRHSIVVDPNVPNMEDMLTSLAEQLKGIEPFKYTYNDEKVLPISIILYIADSHVGADNTGSLYENTYNSQEYDRRIGVIFDRIGDLFCTYGTFENLVVVDLGDNLDGYNGMTTRANHPLKQNMNNRQQFNTYVNTQCKLWESLVMNGVAKNYTFYTVNNSNHSGDFGYMANRAIEIYLNARFPQVKVELFTDVMNHFILNDSAYIVCHGKDTEDMKFGLPLHLNDKTFKFISDYIDYHKLGAYKSVNFVKGDLHQAAYEKNSKFSYRNIPSLFGASKWIMNNFGRNTAGYSLDLIVSDNVFMANYEY